MFARINYRENVLVMVPASMQKEMRLFQNSPLSKKFFIVVEADSEAALAAALPLVQEIKTLKPAPALGPEFLLSYYYHLPAMWSEQLQGEISPKTAPSAVKEQMQQNMARLYGPEGQFFTDFILADPLGILEVSGKYLKALNITGGALNFKGGVLTAPDGKSALLIYDAPGDSFDRQTSAELINEVAKINAQAPPGARIFAMGAARYTQENNDIVARDVKRVLGISSILMLIIFLIFFRSKGALFIYAVPVLVLIPASVFTFYIFGEISGITLGFGSILMGMAIDYCVYMYYAFKASSPATEGKKIVRAMAAPIVLSALTSIISFTILYFCAITLFKQIAVFAAGGLALALFIAFAVAPLFFKKTGAVQQDFKFAPRISRARSLALLGLILLCGAAAFRYVKFDTSLDSLNTVSTQFEADRAAFNKLTAGAEQRGSLLFVFGENEDDALDKSRAIALLSGQKLPVSDILLSSKTRAQNTARFHAFWTDEKINEVKKNISAAAEEYGIKPAAFDSFFNFLKTARAPQGTAPFDLSAVYNPFASGAVVHIVDAGFKLPSVFEGEAALISQNLIQSELFYNVMKTLFVLLLIVFIVDALMLSVALKNIKMALLAFLPAACAAAAICIVCAVFGVRLNLFALFTLPLIMGIAADYAIFIIHRHTGDKDLLPPRAVLTAACTSIAGFGALIVAEHKVLFAIGFTITIGIFTAVLVSVFLLPPLLKNAKKVLPALLIMLLMACAPANIKYGVPVPNYAAPEVKEYYGQLGGKMLFNAVAAEEEGAVRLVILNEFAIKLADFTVRPGGADVHYKAEFLPKRAANALAEFFINYYYGSKISYNNLVVLYDDN